MQKKSQNQEENAKVTRFMILWGGELTKKEKDERRDRTKTKTRKTRKAKADQNGCPRKFNTEEGCKEEIKCNKEKEIIQVQETK